jgi:hypothetical protein
MAIKCLLLLAAVLSFAMNAAAFQRFPPGQPDSESESEDEADLQAQFADMDARAAQGRFEPSQYVLQEDEDGSCMEENDRSFEHCLYCCIHMSCETKDGMAWAPIEEVFIDYRTLCVCEAPPVGEIPYSDDLCDDAARRMGVVEN